MEVNKKPPKPKQQQKGFGSLETRMFYSSKINQMLA